MNDFNDYEIVDGKRIPMRSWNVVLTSKELALIAMSIFGYVICDSHISNDIEQSLRTLVTKLSEARSKPSLSR